jgi:ribosomal protein S20
MSKLKNQLKDNELALKALTSVEEKIEEVETLSAALEQKTEQIIDVADLDDRKAVDEVTRNRTRLEMIPRILSRLRTDLKEATDAINGEVRASIELLRRAYPQIEEAIRPQAVKACVAMLGEEFRDLPTHVQGEAGLWKSKIWKEKVVPWSRNAAKFANSESPQRGIEVVNEELARVADLLEEIEKERKPQKATT